MNAWLEEAELLIFDLDGTLYENTDHFEYLAEKVKHKLPTDKQAIFDQQYMQIKSGEHPLTTGKVYDAENDRIITLDPITQKAVAVHEWDGKEWPEDKVKMAYPDRLSFDFERMVAVGDGWWLSPVAGGHLGVEPKELYDAYLDTMKYMATDDFNFVKASGLKEALIQLSKTKPIVLVTNSKEDDACSILRALGLQDVFMDAVYAAEKPAQTADVFQMLLERYHVDPEKAVAIGDNFINEITPALLLGMKAIYIQTYGHRETEGRLRVVKSLAEVI